MIMDELLEFADAESVAAAAGTALIGDVIDLGANGEQLGDGEELYLVIQCATTIITGGAAGTIKFQLASDAAAAIATNGSASVHIDTGTFVTDGEDANELHAGDYIYVGRIPNGHNPAYERYLGGDMVDYDYPELSKGGKSKGRYPLLSRRHRSPGSAGTRLQTRTTSPPSCAASSSASSPTL